jgi:hypothetical protein
MEFRQATEDDLTFVKAHSLYPPTGKENSDAFDFVYTLEHGEYILGIGGFRMITDATAWAWIELTEFVGSHIIATYRVISEYMEIFCTNHTICRLQAWVDKDFQAGNRTAFHLGFSVEQQMKDFLGKGRDAILYVKYFGVE